MPLSSFLGKMVGLKHCVRQSHARSATHRAPPRVIAMTPASINRDILTCKLHFKPWSAKQDPPFARKKKSFILDAQAPLHTGRHFSSPWLLWFSKTIYVGEAINGCSNHYKDMKHKSRDAKVAGQVIFFDLGDHYWIFCCNQSLPAMLFLKHNEEKR